MFAFSGVNIFTEFFRSTWKVSTFYAGECKLFLASLTIIEWEQLTEFSIFHNDVMWCKRNNKENKTRVKSNVISRYSTYTFLLLRVRVFVRVFHLLTSSPPRYFPSPSDDSFRCFFFVSPWRLPVLCMKRCLIYIKDIFVLLSLSFTIQNSFLFIFSLLLLSSPLHCCRINVTTTEIHGNNSHTWEEDKSLERTRWHSLHNINSVFVHKRDWDDSICSYLWS